MKNICLASIPAPWFFGPYAKQLYMLADQFIKMNKNYTLYYLCLGFDMKQKIYTYTEILENFDDDHTNKKSTNATNLLNKKETLEKIKFIGGIEKINGGYTVSSFNKVMSYFNIDCLITCMDLVTLINDEIFKIKSLTWFPNHFQPIRSFDISKLQLFLINSIIFILNCINVIILNIYNLYFIGFSSNDTFINDKKNRYNIIKFII